MAPPNKRHRRGKEDSKHDAENLPRSSRPPADLSTGKAPERERSASGMEPAYQGAVMHRHNMPGAPHGAARAYHNYNPAYPTNHSSCGPQQHHSYASRPTQGQTQVENKKASFEQFLEQLREFFSMIGAWYGVSGPIVLHYLREQILVRYHVLFLFFLSACFCLVFVCYKCCARGLIGSGVSSYTIDLLRALPSLSAFHFIFLIFIHLYPPFYFSPCCVCSPPALCPKTPPTT